MPYSRGSVSTQLSNLGTIVSCGVVVGIRDSREGGARHVCVPPNAATVRVMCGGGLPGGEEKVSIMLLALLSLLFFHVGADAELPLPQQPQIAVILHYEIAIMAITESPNIILSRCGCRFLLFY
jgi:hypothetical protein